MFAYFKNFFTILIVTKRKQTNYRCLAKIISVVNYLQYKIADFNFKIKTKYGAENLISEKYISNDGVDLDVETTYLDIEFEDRVAEEKFSSKYLEFTAIQRKIAEWLPSKNAFVLHSATFDVDGVGVAFAAHSGTGKTTHMNLWQNLLGERMVVVNGDKPIVRFFEDESFPFAYGTPWNGKERLGCNMRTPLKHICFIERATENSCEKMSAKDAVDRIFNQVYMPKNPVAVMNTMSLIDRLISTCSLWKIKCNMEPEAAKVAYNTIFNSEC